MYKHPEWMDQAAFFMDSMFDWLGYTGVPHTLRYSICLTILLMPVWTAFFLYCCVHNDEYEDPDEELKFKHRVRQALEREKLRYREAK